MACCQSCADGGPCEAQPPTARAVPPPPPGSIKCLNIPGGGGYWPGVGCPNNCELRPGGVTCCYYDRPAGDPRPGPLQKCTDRLTTIDPFGPAPAQAPPKVSLPPSTRTRATLAEGATAMYNGHGCQPGCSCPAHPPSIQTPGGQRTFLQPAAGRGESLCWGIIGGESADASSVPSGDVAAGAQQVINIGIAEYSWFRPRKMAANVREGGSAPTNPGSMAIWARVLRVEGVGRQVIGSSAGISARSIDAASDNALHFSRSVSPINSGNTIRITWRNDHPTLDLAAAFDIEGEAQQ